MMVASSGFKSNFSENKTKTVPSKKGMENDENLTATDVSRIKNEANEKTNFSIKNFGDIDM